MKCSIVIRAYNEGKYIGRLLEGIHQQTIKDVEIILVDSGSTDNTRQIAESYSVKIVHIPPHDFTFGRSLNLGIKHATNELIVIVSAHVFPVYPDWLERMLEPFANPNVVLTYGKQRGTPPKNRINTSHSQPDQVFHDLPSTHFSEHQIFERWFPEEPNPKQTHPFCNNANAAIRRSLWQKNSYDETLTGLEDLAWAKWALSESGYIAYIPEAEIIHVHNETPKGVFNRYRREAMAFKHIYPEAHFNFYDFLRMTSSNIINDLWHAVNEKKFLESFASIFWFRWNQFRGTYQGYRQSLEWNWQLRQTFYYPRGIEPGTPTKRNVEPIRYNK